MLKKFTARDVMTHADHPVLVETKAIVMASPVRDMPGYVRVWLHGSNVNVILKATLEDFVLDK